MKEKINIDFDKDNYKIISFYVYCSIETAIKRDVERTAKTIGEEGIRKIYSEFNKSSANELLIDTDRLSIEESINEMLSHIVK